MYCKNCGSKLDDDARFCPHCGTAVTRTDTATGQPNAAAGLDTDDPFSSQETGNSAYTQNQGAQQNPYSGQPYQQPPYQQPPYQQAPPQQNYQQYNYYPYPQPRPEDAKSGGFAALCFFFPIVGLILFIIWHDTLPLRAGSCGKGALAGVITWVVLFILIYAIIIGTASCVISNVSYAVLAAL
ncbi:MAG: zinc ribbon domain-containing protein [Clostridia bacterium]|nr:zinc ribbon domain-containing protein [Clostridia bacterium]